MGSSTSTVTQTNSNIGPSQAPYYRMGMQAASSLLTTPYQRYVNADGTPIERIAGFTDQQKALQQQTAGLQAPTQYGQATDFVNQAGLGSLAAAQYNPAAFNAQQVTPDQLAAYQMQGPDSLTQQGMVQQYMSPFLQAALEPQLREAQLGAKRTQLAGDLGAARQGTYGGSRALLASMERERNLGQNLGDIRSRGYQTAFEQAQSQFNTEQSARQNAAMKNLEAMLGIQRLGAEQSLAAQQSNQQQGLEAQRLAEQSRQFGAGNELKAYEQMGQLGQTLANIGQGQQNSDIARLGFQQQTAAQEQALQQQYLTQGYQDFLTQRDYPYQQYQRYMNLLSAVPVAQSSTQTQSTPTMSVGERLLGGAGLAALGSYTTGKGI